MEQESQRTKDPIEKLDLPKGCTCFEPGVGVRCKAKDVGLDSYAQCLEKEAFNCPFAVPYAHSFYCKCPVRVYIAKECKN